MAFKRIYLILCFLYGSFASYTQVVEKDNYRFSNTDTVELLNRLDAAEKISGQHPDSAIQKQ
jgi:hypothetical protein